MISKKSLRRNLLLLVICLASLVFWGGIPHKAEASNEGNPPRAIRLDDIFVTPSTGTDSSIIGGNIVQITPAKKDQKGGIWSTEANKIDLTEDFYASMYIYLGDNASPTQGGDGMALVMHNDPRGTDALSPYFGESLGVWASSSYGARKDEGIQNSIAVEFDKYVNNLGIDSFFDRDASEGHHVAWGYPGKDSTYDDYTVDGVAIIRNRRALIHNDVQYVANFSNDTWRKLDIYWDAAKQEITGHLDGVSVVTIPIDVQDVFGVTEVYWGFTGSTGGSNADQRVTFDEVPGLAHAEVYKEITKEDGTVVTDAVPVYEEEELTYNIHAQYLSGKQDWFQIAMTTTIDSNVSYVPGSLTITEGTNEPQSLDDKLWSGNTLTVPAEIFGNMDSDRDDVTISFKVMTQSVEKDTSVTEEAYFLGDNLNIDTDPITYHILPHPAPEVVIGEEGPIYIPVGEDYTVRGIWKGVNSAWVKMMYKLNDIVIEDLEFITNENPGESVEWSVDLRKKHLTLGTHKFEVRVSDDRSASTAELTINVVNPPSITLVGADTEVPVALGDGYTIEGTWSDADSDTVDLFYVINDDEPVKFADKVKNATNKGEAVNFEYTISESQLPIGKNTVTVYAVDDTGIKSNEDIITLVVEGTLTFTNVSENVYFEDAKISDTATISKRSEGWNIAVKDTRGADSTWRVAASLSEEFSDGKGHYLEDALIYVDADGNDKSMKLGDAVDVFKHTTMDENEVSINWDEDKGVLLKISPYFYTGEYTGAITWALVDAP